MISSTTLSIPRAERGSTHSINAAGITGGSGWRSGSHDWSNYAYPPSQAVLKEIQAGIGNGADDQKEPFNLENFVLLR